MCAMMFDGSRLTTSRKSRSAAGQSSFRNSRTARSARSSDTCVSWPKPLTEQNNRQHARTSLRNILVLPFRPTAKKQVDASGVDHAIHGRDSVDVHTVLTGAQIID